MPLAEANLCFHEAQLFLEAQIKNIFLKNQIMNKYSDMHETLIINLPYSYFVGYLVSTLEIDYLYTMVYNKNG